MKLCSCRLTGITAVCNLEQLLRNSCYENNWLFLDDLDLRINLNGEWSENQAANQILGSGVVGNQSSREERCGPGGRCLGTSTRPDLIRYLSQTPNICWENLSIISIFQSIFRYKEESLPKMIEVSTKSNQSSREDRCGPGGRCLRTGRDFESPGPTGQQGWKKKQTLSTQLHTVLYCFDLG